MSAALLGSAAGLLIGVAAGLLVRARALARSDADRVAALARLDDALAQRDRLERQLADGDAQLAAASAQLAGAQTEVALLRRAADERSAEVEKDLERMTGAFAELSSRALAANTEHFLSLADTRLKEATQAAQGDLAQRQAAITQLLVPLRDTLSKYEEGLRELELDRKGAYVGLTEQVKALSSSQEQLHKETRSLVGALRSPQTRGRWGEVQLRRVVEMAGMLSHCDFEEQVTTTTDAGRFRPDLVVHLPGGAQVVVDAKVPLDAFLSAAEADEDEVRKLALVSHARQLRTHVDQLAKKEYWSQFDPSPEFVVAFVPGDPLLAAAFEHDPALIEHAMASRVLLTTPTTLIALLRTVAYGWQQEDLAANAREVQRQGAELYERLRVLGGHLTKLQRHLSGSVDAFNDAVGSIESRVLVTARRFPDLGVVGHGAKEIGEVGPVVAVPRHLQAPELVAPDEGAHAEGTPDGGSLLQFAAPAGDDASGLGDAAG